MTKNAKYQNERAKEMAERIKYAAQDAKRDIYLIPYSYYRKHKRLQLI